MNVLRRIFPWHDPEGEKMKEKRVDDAVKSSTIVEDRIKKLAEANAATAFVIVTLRDRTR